MLQVIEIYVRDPKVELLLQTSVEVLDGDDSLDVEVFRRLVEQAMYLGIWNGSVGLA
jgi:hypothetical protein